MLYRIQRRTAWIILLVAASALLSRALACATPFAAFAALAAITLPRREAVLVAASVWLANQAVGFAVLSYPVTSDSLVWSAILSVSTVATALVVQAVGRRAAHFGAGASIAAGFLVSQVAFRGLMIFSASIMGGIEGFTVENLAYLSALDAATFVGLLALVEIGAFLGRTVPVPSRMAQPRA